MLRKSEVLVLVQMVSVTSQTDPCLFLKTDKPSEEDGNFAMKKTEQDNGKKKAIPAGKHTLSLH